MRTAQMGDEDGNRMCAEAPHVRDNRLASRGSGCVCDGCCLSAVEPEASSFTYEMASRPKPDQPDSPKRSTAASPALCPARVVCVAESAGVYTPIAGGFFFGLCTTLAS